MSQPYEGGDAEHIKEVTEALLYRRIALSIAILLPLYEYVITFDQEVTAVWLRTNKLSAGSILLVSTRWCMVLSAVAGLLPPQAVSCKALFFVPECLQLFVYAQVAVFSALRVSAIWDRNRWLFLAILFLSLPPVVTNAFVAASTTFHHSKGACSPMLNLSNWVVDMLELVTRVPVVVADVLVLILTWIKTYKQVALARRTGTKVSISTCLLRDGTVYFIVLLGLNLSELIPKHSSGSTATNNPVIVIPPILINRFILNLRKLDTKNDTQAVEQSSDFSAPRFRVADSIYGNFGEPLEHGASPREDGEDIADGSDFPSRVDDARGDDGDELRETAASGDAVKVHLEEGAYTVLRIYARAQAVESTEPVSPVSTTER